MKLLETYQLGPFTLRNRVVMAPMTRNRLTAEGLAGTLAAEYYHQRATMGLLISEAVAISADAIGYPMIPGLYNKAQVESWRGITDRVHDAGGLIFAQLWQSGRAGHSSAKDGGVMVAPSVIAIRGQQIFTKAGLKDFEVPRALTTAEVGAIIRDYQDAAERAMEAGFDGIELNAANGYLPNQFLADGVNIRDDEYGGGVENRCRFILEAMDAMVQVCGPGRVGIKLSPSTDRYDITESNPLALYGYLVGALNPLPLAYLHFMQPLSAVDAAYWPKDVITAFGGLTVHPVIANGGYNQQRAEQEVASGRAQLVSFGALALANPDLPARFAEGAPLNTPDASTFYGGNEHGYTDYPFWKK